MDKQNDDGYLIVATGKIVKRLKDVRGELGCSGRAIKHAFRDGRVKKVNNKYVHNDEQKEEQNDIQ